MSFAPAFPNPWVWEVGQWVEAAGRLPSGGPHLELAVAAQGPRARLEPGYQPPGPRPASTDCPWPGPGGAGGGTSAASLSGDPAEPTRLRAGRSFSMLAGQNSSGQALPLMSCVTLGKSWSVGAVCVPQGGTVPEPHGQSSPWPFWEGAVASLVGRWQVKSQLWAGIKHRFY